MSNDEVCLDDQMEEAWDAFSSTWDCADVSLKDLWEAAFKRGHEVAKEGK